MIIDHLAIPLSKVATKSFTKMKDSKKVTIQRVFVDQWDEFLQDPEVKRKGLREIVVQEVLKMMACGTLDCGFEIYECPHCHKSHIICYTCKSRFCNSCGTKYAKQRAEHISNATLNVSHRHVVFTIDDRLRVYFKKDRNCLSFLFDAASDTLFYAFNKMKGKKHTFKPGFILTLHTFGRALNWNPHIHCLLTEGGMDKDNNYKAITYINYETLRKSFMKQLLDKLKAYYKIHHPSEFKQLCQLINTLYKEDTHGFYVNAPHMKNKKGKEAVVNYIIRYTGRSVMAQSRILDYDRNTKQIHYYYEDHKTEERIEVFEHAFSFMKKLIMHIPEAQFKMIRYFGLYAACKTAHKGKVKKMLMQSLHPKSTYRKDLIELFDTDPLLCECGHYLEYVDYWVPPSRRKDDSFYDTS